MGEVTGRQKNIKKKLYFERWKVVSVVLAVYDVGMVCLGYFLALWLRFDCQFSIIPLEYLGAYISFIPIYIISSLIVFVYCRLYNSIWRFASYVEFMRVIAATVITSLFQTGIITIFYHRMPISYYCLGTVFEFLAVLGIRFSYRFILLLRTNHLQTENEHRVMLIGAGAAGRMLLRDMRRAKEYSDKVCCIIDDDPNKWNRYIEGLPVVGGRDDILANVKKYKVEKIFLAIPSARSEQKRDILTICNETACELKQLPGLYELVNDQATVGAMKEVSVEDLLGREPIKANLEEVFEFLSGKCILVTGGGGSIGSEICRQVAEHNPKQLIIFDIYENNAYDIQLELKEKYPNLDLVTLIGSVRDSRKINQVFKQYKPDVVFHAAAHKHVPLMEESPCEAIKNNAIGTYKTAYAAMLYGCKRFVLISTDKAVNPTNIMGASKRLCEMIIQSFDEKIREGKSNELPTLFTHNGDELGVMKKKRRNLSDVHTEFVAVRFGNVLGSNGSVVPLFKRQIEKGGPVTVTHPDIIRYFMTIPEAVSLVLQAGTYAHGGEIFVLDMGCPVKIDTLARNLIKLSGYKPDVDIKVEYSGLRPGEKLYEEKLMSEEGLKTTANHLIHIGSPIPFDTNNFLKQLEGLMGAAYANSDSIKELVSKVVSTYHPEGEEGIEKSGKAYVKLVRKPAVSSV